MSEMLETPETASQLWLPGQEMRLFGSNEYPVPLPHELEAAWAAYVGEAAIATPGVYGATRLPNPNNPPNAVLSVDLCEVVRETGAGVRTIEEPDLRPGSSQDSNSPCAHHYGEGLSVHNQIDAASVVTVLMNGDYIEPVKDIGYIHAILASCRKLGIFVVANTSTLPGCELATIRFMKRNLPNAFDGLLLPRNHDNSSPLTKGVAVRMLIDRLLFKPSTPENRFPTSPLTVVHVDDVSEHNRNFHRAFEKRDDVGITTIQPLRPSCFPLDEGSIHTPNSLDAFRTAATLLSIQDTTA